MRARFDQVGVRAGGKSRSAPWWRPPPLRFRTTERAAGWTRRNKRCLRRYGNRPRCIVHCAVWLGLAVVVRGSQSPRPPPIWPTIMSEVGTVLVPVPAAKERLLVRLMVRPWPRRHRDHDRRPRRLPRSQPGSAGRTLRSSRRRPRRNCSPTSARGPIRQDGGRRRQQSD